MLTIHQRSRRLPAALAALAVAFAVGACGGDDDSDRAQTESAPVGDDATTSPAQDDASSAGAAGERPQDRELDVDVRNPDGTALTLSHIAFEGDNILVDMEVLNGSSRMITIHSTAGGDGALRLVDDTGNVYSFLAPPEESQAVYTTVEQGETLSGTFAFVGPLVGQPDQLRLVTNVAADEIDTWSLDNEVDRGVCCLEPGFVVPIDLTWG